MAKLKKIILEVYSLQELHEELAFLPVPCNYRDFYSVSVKRYGFIHDVGYKTILEPSSNPTGWDSLATVLKDARKDMLISAEIAELACYH